MNIFKKLLIAAVSFAFFLWGVADACTQRAACKGLRQIIIENSTGVTLRAIAGDFCTCNSQIPFEKNHFASGAKLTGRMCSHEDINFAGCMINREKSLWVDLYLPDGQHLARYRYEYTAHRGAFEPDHERPLQEARIMADLTSKYGIARQLVGDAYSGTVSITLYAK